MGIFDVLLFLVCVGIEIIEFIDCFELYDLVFLFELKFLKCVMLEGMLI